MNIQDKYFAFDNFVKLSLLKGNISPLAEEYWSDLTKWLKTKKFFGEWGYDPNNHVFLKEPEDPAQQKLFQEA